MMHNTNIVIVMFVVSTEKILDQWRAYDSSYEELNGSLKEMETRMRGSGGVVSTEPQPSLDAKRELCAKYTRYHAEVKDKQSQFDSLSERTHLLMSSCSADAAIASQLTQLSSRYTALLTFTKDTCKRLEQQVDDHSQYRDAHDKAATWLADMRQRLAAYTDTASTADRDEVQGQLERLHEFMALKEQGQTLLHAANTWGEKTLVTTSGEGRAVIQRELQVRASVPL